jgi:hypothetical protein
MSNLWGFRFRTKGKKDAPGLGSAGVSRAARRASPPATQGIVLKPSEFYPDTDSEGGDTLGTAGRMPALLSNN